MGFLCRHPWRPIDRLSIFPSGYSYARLPDSVGGEEIFLLLCCSCSPRLFLCPGCKLPWWLCLLPVNLSFGFSPTHTV